MMAIQHGRRYFLQAGLAAGIATSARFGFADPAIFEGSGVFDARAFGAKGNGEALDTGALQRAIDAAAASGGLVYVSPGTYRTGTLFLKSNVSLQLEAGATLLGSKNLEDYPSVQPALRSYTDTYVHQSLIYGENLENVALLGRGTIDGQGGAFRGEYRVRPYLIRMVGCRNVQVADLTMKDSPMWVQHYLACENLAIRGLAVHSRCNENNDGIDIDACRNVRISDCEVWSGDDAIVLKSTLAQPCRDVTITNCVLSSDCNALKLGTESVGGFDNIVISNCSIYDTHLSGLALELVDGGLLENVSVSNLVMRDVRSAIFLRLGNRARPPYEGAPNPGLGRLRNVVVQNVQATGADKIGCAVVGLAERPLENVTLSNIRIRFEGGGTEADTGLTIPELAEAYPEYKMFGVLPAYAFYCRHVRNIRFLDVEVAPEREEFRPALVSDDVQDLKLSDFRAANSNPVLLLRNTRHAWIQGSHAPEGNQVYLRLQGRKTENVRLVTNDLRRSARPVDRASEVPPDSVIEEAAVRTGL
ncbi:MAG: glycoside hydrolase family 28 protein [Acidobacteriota bacterium]